MFYGFDILKYENADGFYKFISEYKKLGIEEYVFFSLIIQVLKIGKLID